MADARLRPERIVAALVIVSIAVALGVWGGIRHARAEVRERGLTACVASGRARATCVTQIDAHHERCMELTYRPSSRSGPESFDTTGYVECIETGPDAFWDASARRAAERRR